MKFAPNDPDGVHARRFLQAWQNSFGRPPRSMARGIHEMYLRSEGDQIACIRPPKPRELSDSRPALLPGRLTAPAPAPARIALSPPRLPWWKRVLKWLSLFWNE